MDNGPELIDKITTHTEHTFFLKLVVNGTVDQGFELKKNLGTLLLAAELHRDGVLQKENILKLNEYFHSVADIDEAANTSTTKEINPWAKLLEKHGDDEGKLLEGACRLVNADSDTL